MSILLLISSVLVTPPSYDAVDLGCISDGQLATTGEYPDGSKRPYLLTPTNTSIPEDINGDGVVDVVDLLAVISAWSS